jgi:RNA polymerase sigma-70 factor (ECF subfamily)
MWPDATETQQLLDNARRAAPGAVDALLARHREALRRAIALRLDPAVARRLDASDVVQDVLLEASRRLNDYLQKPVMPFHLWLRSLAKDHMIDAHRRHRQAQRRSVDREQALHQRAAHDRSSMDLAAALVDPELTPASAAMRAELASRFQDALAELAEDDREIIVLRHFEQLSNQDAATLLGVSGSAAAMRYMRAVRRLQAVLMPAERM